ncbi:hypothetical protein ACWC0C_43065 [Streptomyces sp. NPDC001709]
MIAVKSVFGLEDAEVDERRRLRGVAGGAEFPQCSWRQGQPVASVGVGPVPEAVDGRSVLEWPMWLPFPRRNGASTVYMSEAEVAVYQDRITQRHVRYNDLVRKRMSWSPWFRT